MLVEKEKTTVNLTEAANSPELVDEPVHDVPEQVREVPEQVIHEVPERVIREVPEQVTCEVPEPVNVVIDGATKLSGSDEKLRDHTMPVYSFDDNELLRDVHAFVGPAHHATSVRKQRFNFAYFFAAALSMFEVGRGGCDIRTTMNYFYQAAPLKFHDFEIASSPALLLSILFVAFSVVALQCCLHSRSNQFKFSAPDTVHLSRRTRKWLRAAAIAIPIPFFLASCLSVAGYACLIKADKAFDKLDLDEAQADLEMAARLDSNLNGQSYSGLSMVYWHRNDIANALTYSNRAIALDPKDAIALKVRAANTYGQESLDDARKAVDLDPEDGEGYRVLSDSALRMGQTGEAVTAARQHSKLHSTESAAPIYLATALNADGKYEEAIQAIQPLLANDKYGQARRIYNDILKNQNRNLEQNLR